MAEARKFLFDRDFTREQPVVPAGEPVVEEPPPDPATLPAYSEIDLQAVRAAAYAEGFESGKAEGLDEGSNGAEAMIARAVALAGQALERLLSELASQGEIARQDAAALALAVGRKIAGIALARHPLAEIEAMIAQCLADMDETRAAARVVIRCAPGVTETLNEHMTALTARLHFPGKVIVLADPALAEADCRVEWADGGAERDQAQIEARIADSIARFMAATPGGDELPSMTVPLPPTVTELAVTEAAAAEWADAPDPGVKSLDKGGKSKRVEEPAAAPESGVKNLDKGGKSKRISDPA